MSLSLIQYIIAESILEMVWIFKSRYKNLQMLKSLAKRREQPKELSGSFASVDENGQVKFQLVHQDLNFLTFSRALPFIVSYPNPYLSPKWSTTSGFDFYLLLGPAKQLINIFLWPSIRLKE